MFRYVFWSGGENRILSQACLSRPKSVLYESFISLQCDVFSSLTLKKSFIILQKCYWIIEEPMIIHDSMRVSDEVKWRSQGCQKNSHRLIRELIGRLLIDIFDRLFWRLNWKGIQYYVLFSIRTAEQIVSRESSETELLPKNAEKSKFLMRFVEIFNLYTSILII